MMSYSKSGRPISTAPSFHNGVDDKKLSDEPVSFQRKYMRTWFHNNYQISDKYVDVSNQRLPPGRAKNSFLRVDDILTGRFEGIVDEWVIQSLVDELETEGVEWQQIKSESVSVYEHEIYIQANNDPLKKFLESVRETESLLDCDQLQKFNPTHIMVFVSHMVELFGAYLFERMIHEVRADKGVVIRMLAHDNYFINHRIKMSDLADNFAYVEDMVVQRLEEIAWYKLDLVNDLYGKVLSVDFSDMMEKLNPIIEQRHRIVHRSKEYLGSDILNLNADQVMTSIRTLIHAVEVIDTRLKTNRINQDSCEA